MGLHAEEVVYHLASYARFINLPSKVEGEVGTGRPVKVFN
jgi:hypothetical protein